MIRRKPTLMVLAAAAVLTASFGLGHLTTMHAQDKSTTTTVGDPAPPPAPKDGGPGPKRGPGPGPGPRGERPPPPPRPEDEQPAQPVDPNGAPVAVNNAKDTLAGLTVGQVWTRTAPRGEQQLQASLVFQGKEVGRLEFNPATGALLARGQHTPLPPPGGPAADQKPVTAANTDATTTAPDAVAPDATAPTADATTKTVPTAKLDDIKKQLPGLLKSLVVAPGAEVMPREGYWKVALIADSRVVGELRFSGDGKKVVQDFGATRDAAMFAR